MFGNDDDEALRKRTRRATLWLFAAIAVGSLVLGWIAGCAFWLVLLP